MAAKAAVRTVTTILGSLELDRLDSVAGVDRPLEGLGPEHFCDVGNLHHVEERGDPRHDILGAGGRGRDDGVVAGRERHDQPGERLGQRVGVSRVIGGAHFGDAGKLRGARRSVGDVLPGDQHIDGRAELDRRSQRACGHVAQGAASDLGQKKGRHDQITPASSCSLATSSATVFTFTPALRPPGSAVFSTLSRGATSTP